MKISRLCEDLRFHAKHPTPETLQYDGHGLPFLLGPASQAFKLVSATNAAKERAIHVNIADKFVMKFVECADGLYHMVVKPKGSVSSYCW